MKNNLDLPFHLPNSRQNGEKDTKSQNIEEKEVIEKESKQQTSSKEEEESIKKWIEERKKRWPSRKVIEMKKKQKEMEEHNKVNIMQAKPNKKRTTNQEKRNKNYGSTHTVEKINNQEVLIPKFYGNVYFRADSRKDDCGEGQRFSLFNKLVKKEQMEQENLIFLDFLQFLEQKKMINHEIFLETT